MAQTTTAVAVAEAPGTDVPRVEVSDVYTLNQVIKSLEGVSDEKIAGMLEVARKKILEKRRGERILQRFSAQLETLIRTGYPAAVGMTPQEFVNSFLPLLTKIGPDVEKEGGRIPLLLVVPACIVPLRVQETIVSAQGVEVRRMFAPCLLERAPGVSLPLGPYIATDVGCYERTNYKVSDIVRQFQGKGREEIVPAELLAIALHVPGALRGRKGILGTRDRLSGDRAISLSYQCAVDGKEWISFSSSPMMGAPDLEVWSCAKRIR